MQFNFLFVPLSYIRNNIFIVMGLRVHSSIIDVSNLSSDSIREGFVGVQKQSICGVVFCGTSSEIEYHQLLDYLKQEIYSALGRRVPVTLIPQYLLPKGGLSMDVYTIDGSTKISTEQQDGVCYGKIECGEESLLFIEGIAATDFTNSVKQQSQEVFSRLDAILSAHNFSVSDIVRQWNYIGSIVACREEKQNYQEFNDARTIYYSQGQWQNGYPAATGIGASGEGIIVGCIAFKCNDDNRRAIYPIDNPLQVAAHVYSKQVLIDKTEGAMKSTPKFERAKLIETQRGACCFVSGTAAIRGEQSAAKLDAKEQAIMTIENIEHLVSPENLQRHFCKPYNLKYAQIQTFIKHAEDFEQVKSVVDKAYPELTVLYSIADVCRSELLVEIEGILISQ